MRMKSSDNKGNKNYKTIILFALLVTAIAGVGAKDKINTYFKNMLGSSASETNNSDEFKMKVKEALKDIIIDDTQFVIEAFKQAELKQMQQKIINSKALMEKSGQTPVFGKQDSDITLVYFFDYNCKYCKTANAIVNKVFEKHNDIKIIYKEFPILGQKSKEFAKNALAVYLLDKNKYIPFHDAIMANTGENALDNALKLVGISRSDFDQAIKNPAIENEIDGNYKLASEIRLGGTPAFILNDVMIGEINEDAIMKKIAEIRSGKNK